MSDPSFAARLRSLADEAPDAPAVTFTGSGECLTIAELVAGAHRLGRSLQSLGATQGSFVTIAEPNGVEFFLGVAACWMIGATPQPVSPRLAESELRAIIELAEGPRLVSSVVGCDQTQEALQLDMALKATFVPFDEVTVLAFEPATSESGAA